ncbi:unnamed protein product [Rotaria sp. Silwood1]|nr:unnamed protein product [Rotaria sp. Silwood1]CAF4850115.1 unnamed protein product [Rotaria sp. Silwood1]
MASVTAKQLCIKCDKGGGVATCGGCQQWFCVKHFNEHRQELAIGMDNLGEEHDLLQRDLTQGNAMHDLVSYVNDWEQKSITKIQAVAEQARIDIQKYLDHKKQQLKTSLNQVANELKSSRQSDGYTEIDLKKWMEQVKQIREMLENPSTIRIIDSNDVQSIIHLIQDHMSDGVPSSHICQKCGRKFSIVDNCGGDCIHGGTWHARYEDCSYLKCGFNLGIKASIGKQHWSCCYSLERESNRCSKSGPHIVVQHEN